MNPPKPELALVNDAWEDQVASPAMPSPVDPMTAQPIERRQLRRPRLSGRFQLQSWLNATARYMYQSRLATTLFLVVQVSALGLIAWTLGERASLIDYAYTEVTRREALEAKRLRLGARWSAEELESVQNGISQAERRVFADHARLARWLHEQHRYARQLGLDFTYRLTDGHPSQIKNVLELPIVIELRVDPEFDGQAYPLMLEFLRNLVGTNWYVNVRHAGITGRGNGDRKLAAELRVWVRGEMTSDAEVF